MGKPRIGSPKLLFKHLDLTPIQPILWAGFHKTGPGRPVLYNPECDLRALMLRQLLQIHYMKDLSKRLRRDPYLRRVCGYGKKAPCEAHFSQMKKRIGVEGFRLIVAWLRHEALKIRASQPLAAAGLVQAACIDGTDLPAWSSRDPHNTRRGLGDPDARVGRGKKGFLLGYQSLFLVDIEGFPLGHVEASLNVNEKQLVEELLTRVLGESLEGRTIYQEFLEEHGERLHHIGVPTPLPFDAELEKWERLGIEALQVNRMEDPGEGWAYMDTQGLVGCILEILSFSRYQ